MTADDDDCAIRDCFGGFRVPLPIDKGARFMDIVSHMELMADCIDPLTMVRDRAAIGICRGACVD